MATSSFDKNVELSIIMPCLNEAETVARCVLKARSFLDAHGIKGEIIVADNGSTDGSQVLASEAGAMVVHVPTRGYGAAIAGGIDAAQGRYVIMGDADDSYDFTDLGSFVEALRDGYDLVMGNRFKGGIKKGAMPFLHRYVGNPILSAIGRLFFRCPVGDFHCGLRGFRRDSVLALQLCTTGMEYASEMVVKASLRGQRITEVPTILSPDGRSRRPHLRTWRDGWRHLRFLLLYSPRWLFLYPGIFLMCIGILFTGLLSLGPIHLAHSVGIDVHTLVYTAVAIVVGYQSVSFAVLTKVFAMNQGLLPVDRRFVQLMRFVTLETGLAVGALMLLLGLGGSIYALAEWSRRLFGPLEDTGVLRVVIPSSIGIALGCQTVLSSFFLSVLGLQTRNKGVNCGF
jgi:glycosyltransferase involved in cell wall biosynthesis